MDIEHKTLEILSEVTGTDATKLDPDFELYDRGLMDSMTTVQLIASLSEHFNLDISPAEFDRDTWATRGCSWRISGIATIRRPVLVLLCASSRDIN